MCFTQQTSTGYRLGCAPQKVLIYINSCNDLMMNILKLLKKIHERMQQYKIRLFLYFISKDRSGTNKALKVTVRKTKPI